MVNQPTAATTTVVRPTGDYYLTLSVVLTVICCLCGTWYSLFCTIPAIVMATSVSSINVFQLHVFISFFLQARDAAARGDLEGAKSKGRTALILNIVACIWWVVALIIIVASVASAVVNARNSYCTNYYSTFCVYK